jgi:uncharacterized membrane protein YozB (DUF420 family)
MEPAVKKTLGGLLILSAILLAGGIAIFRTLIPMWYFPFFPWLVLTFLMVNAGFFIFFYRSLKKSNNEFIRGFMLSTGIKLMIYLLLVLIYVLVSPKTAVSFSVTLSILYIAYTAYDLYIMINLVRRKKENHTMPKQLSN